MTARRALLDGLVDYAGLFPPAALPLDAALTTYADARAGADAWMLSRFIVPAARLGDLVRSTDRDDAMALSVLGLGREDGVSWTDAALRTVEAARAVGSRRPGFVADRFELRIGPDDVPALDGGLAPLAAVLSAGPDGSAAALEVPYLDVPSATEPVAAFVADANGRAGRDVFALKLRCGGVTADAFPAPEALAAAVDAARRAGVPFKATAGLHHPVRHARALGNGETAAMHGFVNLFGGAALARTHGLDADALAEVLDDSDPDRFELGDALRWRSLTADGPDVAEARHAFALSYGSCSFDEPTDDLRALGWLD